MASKGKQANTTQDALDALPTLLGDALAALANGTPVDALDADAVAALRTVPTAPHAANVDADAVANVLAAATSVTSTQGVTGWTRDAGKQYRWTRHAVRDALDALGTTTANAMAANTLASGTGRQPAGAALACAVLRVASRDAAGNAVPWQAIADATSLTSAGNARAAYTAATLGVWGKRKYVGAAWHTTHGDAVASAWADAPRTASVVA